MISVQVIRRIDTRIPTPILSTFMTSTAPGYGLGKLADFRAVKASTQSSSSSSPSWRPVPPAIAKSWNTTTAAQGSSNAHTQRGWTSVVTSGASISTSAANTSTHPSSSVFAPKPTSSEVVPVSNSSTLGGAGSSLSRTVSPAHFPISDSVPDDWEDDV